LDGYVWGNFFWKLKRYRRSVVKSVQVFRIPKDMLTHAKPGETGFANSLVVARFVERSDRK
jgi:hypothetical protein